MSPATRGKGVWRSSTASRSTTGAARCSRSAAQSGSSIRSHSKRARARKRDSSISSRVARRGGRPARGVLPLAAAPACAGLVAAASCVASCVDLPDSDGGRSWANSVAIAHRLADVVEEQFEAGAQVVEAGVAVGRRREAVLRTSAVAGEAQIAVQAVPGSVSRLSSPNCCCCSDETRSIRWCSEMLPSRYGGSTK